MTTLLCDCFTVASPVLPPPKPFPTHICESTGPPTVEASVRERNEELAEADLHALEHIARRQQPSPAQRLPDSAFSRFVQRDPIWTVWRTREAAERVAAPRRNVTSLPGSAVPCGHYRTMADFSG